MPVPGPRTQYGPVPGYTNPANQSPDRLMPGRGRPAPVAEMGRTPGLMQVSRRGNVLGAGQVRQMWRQSVNLINAQAAYSWSTLSPAPGRLVSQPGAVGVTRALRYMTRSLYMGSGIDNTHFSGLHTRIRPKVRSKPVTMGKGQTRVRPTVRNRVTSFGSRVQPLNQPISGAENTQ